MTLSIIEAIKAQTTSSSGSLVATFSAPPQSGDRILAFVMLESSMGDRDSSSFVVSGLGATWRLAYSQSGYSSQVDWIGVYEAVNVNGVSSAVSATESSSVVTSNFAVTCFNVRGVPVGSSASPLYNLTLGSSSNPPILTVSPLSGGDIVMGSWYQYGSAGVPTITTVPVSGWSSYSVTMTSMSVHWRYITTTDTANRTMDSPTDAIYASFGLASQLGSAQVQRAGVETLTTQSSPIRRFNRAGVEAMMSTKGRRYNFAGLEAMTSTKNRRYSYIVLEAMTVRIPYVKGWGQAI